jgi:glycosyltransferase involved in cell wall biosynthesis
MTILFVHSGADLYGASRSLLRLSSRLVSEGSRVIVLLPYDGPLHAALVASGVTVLIDSTLALVTRGRVRQMRGGLALLFDLARSVRHLRGVIREFRPDVVHTNTAIILSSGIAARLENLPHLWHVRESFAEFRLLWTIYQWFMYFFASRVICVSEAVRQQFVSFIRHRKTLVIHNGIPSSEFGSVSVDRVQQFRSSYGLEGFFLVGVVGRLKMVRKGQDTFLKAAALLKADYPDVRFVLIGSHFPGNENHTTALLRLGKELGIENRVVYTGDVPDIRAAYAALDISVLPSEQPEPFGGVVIESMAAGKPVIGTMVGGTCEQIEDEETGLLVPPGDPESLARAIRRLLDDDTLRSKFGEAGRLRYEQKFEFELFYKQMEAIYSQFIGPK